MTPRVRGVIDDDRDRGVSAEYVDARTLVDKPQDVPVVTIDDQGEPSVLDLQVLSTVWLDVVAADLGLGQTGPGQIRRGAGRGRGGLRGRGEARTPRAAAPAAASEIR